MTRTTSSDTRTSSSPARSLLGLVAAPGLAFAMPACNGADEGVTGAAVGAGTGAAVGAGVGEATSGEAGTGAAIGAGAGALGGYIVGEEMEEDE